MRQSARMKAGLTKGEYSNEKSSNSSLEKKNLVGLCDHCGLVEMNKSKVECPEGYALFWDRLSDKDLKSKMAEFKKIAKEYSKEKK